MPMQTFIVHMVNPLVARIPNFAFVFSFVAAVAIWAAFGGYLFVYLYIQRERYIFVHAAPAFSVCGHPGIG